LTRSKTIGWPPTDLKARTGELTPPGMSFWAAAKISSDRVVRRAGAEAGAEGVAELKAGSAEGGGIRCPS
jgi:hypothetical protein